MAHPQSSCASIVSHEERSGSSSSRFAGVELLIDRARLARLPPLASR
jgi:hypothetical protein